MKRKYIYPLLVIIVTVVFYYVEKSIDKTTDNSLKNTVDKDTSGFYYVPTSTTGAVVTHQYYILSYSEKHEQPEWVAYYLKKEHISNNNFKRPYFELDKKVQTSSADWRNYKNSGYDKGHLCPAGDRQFSRNAFKETFLTSNSTPQDHDFNAGIWNQLEQKTRYWAKKYDGIYVITGGILTDDLPTIGYEAVSVPKYFYKILLDNHGKEPKMIAFLIPHKNTKQSLEQFVVPTDQIEMLTHIDFFAALDDQIENRLEASSSKNGWKF